VVETIFTVVAYLLIVAAFVGWATFRVMYRPWRPGGHSTVGRHLIRTADSLLALFGISLISAVVPLPMPLMQVLTVTILAWLCWVAWERVHLLREELARARAAADEGDDPEITVP
jgi:threonine/homoserine/homoserine lactone efflux protein